MNSQELTLHSFKRNDVYFSYIRPWYQRYRRHPWWNLRWSSEWNLWDGRIRQLVDLYFLLRKAHGWYEAQNSCVVGARDAGSTRALVTMLKNVFPFLVKFLLWDKARRRGTCIIRCTHLLRSVKILEDYIPGCKPWRFLQRRGRGHLSHVTEIRVRHILFLFRWRHACWFHFNVSCLWSLRDIWKVGITLKCHLTVLCDRILLSLGEETDSVCRTEGGGVRMFPSVT